MNFKNDPTIKHEYNQANLDWLTKRKLNYPQFSEEDIGHLYDMIQSLVDALSRNNISVDLNHNNQVRMDHRKAIKAAFPKD